MLKIQETDTIQVLTKSDLFVPKRTYLYLLAIILYSLLDNKIKGGRATQVLLKRGVLF